MAPPQVVARKDGLQIWRLAVEYIEEATADSQQWAVLHYDSREYG
jgi:hypothetical protein